MKKNNLAITIFSAVAILASCGTGSAQTYEDAKQLQFMDLTTVNDTIEYSQTVQLVNAPEQYHGILIRIDGLFGYLKEGDAEYFSVLVQDETKCCMEGMDFELKVPKKYPDEFPQVGTRIVVQGIFDSYEGENGNRYCCLREAEMVTEEDYQIQ